MLSAIKILATALLTLLTLAAGIIVLHTTIRLIRHFHKFPMPQALATTSSVCAALFQRSVCPS